MIETFERIHFQPEQIFDEGSPNICPDSYSLSTDETDSIKLDNHAVPSDEDMISIGPVSNSVVSDQLADIFSTKSRQTND